MRILLGYAGDGLHPDTAACMADVDGVEMVDVSADDFAYWREIESRWTGEEDLLLIEQDMVIHDQVLPQLAECPGDWCVFPYEIFNSRQRLTQGLGCTRFSAALQRKVPASEFEADGKLRNLADVTLTGVPWQFLDLVIAERLRIGHGLRPHIHTPDVKHLHDYSGPTLMGLDGKLRHAGEDTGDPRDSPLAVYHRPIPVMHNPGPQKPAIQVYGAAMTPVGSPEDAARLANALKQRYFHEDGTPRDVPAAVDVDRPPAMHFQTDKISQGYFPAYLQIAAEIGTSGRVCEVGVWGGASLHMWQALFPGGIVAGVDNDAGACWPQETIAIVCGQDDPSLPMRLQAVSPDGWDLIIDDASHDGVKSTETFRLLWPLVAPGGWYVLEDWMVGLGLPPWRDTYGTSMLTLAQWFLRLLISQDAELESVTYRYGMAILHKRG